MLNLLKVKSQTGNPTAASLPGPRWTSTRAIPPAGAEPSLAFVNFPADTDFCKYLLALPDTGSVQSMP